jgi:hypothetical protein
MTQFSPAVKTANFHLNPVREALVAGACASLLSAIALVWAGHREIRSPSAPLNAVSHWSWGTEALRKRGLTAKHTVLGYVIHHCASVWWAALHAMAVRHSACAHKPSVVWAGAVATSAIACVVDFKCTPERFTPGFEHHLSRISLLGVYGAFAGGLALGALIVRAGKSAR